jgi:hypothetical protein
MGRIDRSSHSIFGMNNKEGVGKKSTRSRPRRLQKFWSTLEHYGAED